MSTIPKIIWIYWDQGIKNAPDVVKRCAHSWTTKNPSWKVIIIDKNEIHKYVNLELSDAILSKIGLTKKSNLIRLQLLEKYGGVWADATLYCVIPLDNWIYNYLEIGFFAFAKPGRDRLISNWFIASQPNIEIIKTTKELYVDFFNFNEFDNETFLKKSLIQLLALLFNWSTITTKYWLSKFVVKNLKVYPYFIFHYIFERAIHRDSIFFDKWKRSKKIQAKDPHAIFKHGMHKRINYKLKTHIDNEISPVYKLSWKSKNINKEKNSAYNYLFSKF
jgi:uncharacterized membrane protein YwzB